jgi:hypothetical protein
MAARTQPARARKPTRGRPRRKAEPRAPEPDLPPAAPPARVRAKVEPDQLLQRVLGVLDDQVAMIEAVAPAELPRSEVEKAVRIGELLRRLEADLNDPIDLRGLRNMSDHQLEQLERRLGGGQGQ